MSGQTSGAPNPGPIPPELTPASATNHPGAELDEPNLDQIFHILKNERRRIALRYVKEHERPVAIGSLAEHVASHETDKPVSRLRSEERKRAYVGLYQNHLPKMDDVGAVEFNKPRGLIELGDNHHVFDPYLHADENGDDAIDLDWDRWYFLLPLLGMVLFVLAVFVPI